MLSLGRAPRRGERAGKGKRRPLAAGIPSLALSGRFEIAMKIYCRKCSSFPQSLRDSSPIVGSLSHSGVRAFEAFRGFESFPTGMIVSPLHPLRGSFPRWGTRDESAMGIYCRKCRSSPHRLRRSSPGMSLPFSAFSTCTIVRPLPLHFAPGPPLTRGGEWRALTFRPEGPESICMLTISMLLFQAPQGYYKTIIPKNLKKGALTPGSIF